MKRILHVVTWLNRGGIETWLVHFVREAHRVGEFHIDVLCRADQAGILAPKVEELGANVSVLPMKLSTRANVKRLASFFTAGRYDLVHAHLNAHNSLAVKAAKVAGIPSVAMFHNENLEASPERVSGFIRKLLAKHYVATNLRYAVRNADLVAPSSSAVQRALYRYCTDSRKPNRVIHLGVSRPRALSVEDVARVRSEIFQVATNQLVILHVGAFKYQKNHDGLLDIFQCLRGQGMLAKLVLVGNGQRWDEIKSRVNSHAFAGDILMLRARDDIDQLMASADCFLLPSWHEGLPQTVMEAFANGCPVVASDIPSTREALGDSYELELAAPADANKFAEILIKLLNDKEQRSRLIEDGKRRFEEQFSIEVSYQSMRKAYCELLNVGAMTLLLPSVSE